MPNEQESKYRYPVNPVKSCPKTEEEWRTSAKRLKCSHDQTLKQRYLCIPNQEKTTLLEFCYDLVRPRIVEGFCAELAGTGTLNHESCTHFPAGCPNVSYFSDEIFKYPECLDIDTEQNCFRVEPSCQNRSTQTTTPSEQLSNSSTFFNTTLSPGDSSYNFPVITIGATLGICLPLLILLLIITFSKLKRKKLNKEEEETVPLIGSDDESNINWVTPLTGDLESATEEMVTYLFSMLLKNQPLKQIDLASEEWKKSMNLIRNHLQLESAPNTTTEDILSELRKDKLKKFIIFYSPADTIQFASNDAESEVFRTFFKFAERKHLEIYNSLKFCIRNFSNDVIKKYCRSNTYDRNADERCVLLPRNLTEEMICKLMDDIFNSPTINDPNIHGFVSRKLNIPGEILEGGEQKIRRYIDYLKKGKERIFHARGMIVGCAGAGKTTLLNRLQNKGLKKVKKETKTTIGVDVHRDVFVLEDNELTVNRQKVDTYFHLCPEDNKAYMHQTSVDETQSEESSNDESETSDENLIKISEETKTTENHPLSSEEKGKDNNSSPDLTRISLVNNQSPTAATRTISFTENMETVLSESKNSKEMDANESTFIAKMLHSASFHSKKLVTFLDFAGQCVYYACHQIYLSPRAFYLLVVDMSKDLQEPVDESVNDQEGTMFENWTYEDYFVFWMKSLHTYSNPKQPVPVILVATHAENKSQQEREDFFKSVWKLDEKGIKMKEHLDPNRQFTVGFPTRFSTDYRAETDEIKQCISQLVQKQNHWGELVPSSWVLFEYELKNKFSKSKIIETKLLKQINDGLPEEMKMCEQEFQDMLRFFHEIGIILYFNAAGLRDYVILDTQWFVNAFKHIIMDKKQTGTEYTYVREWEIFYETGEMGDDLLEEIWRHKAEDCLEYKNTILLYMERLGLIAKISSGDCKSKFWYFIPCANRKVFNPEVIKDYRCTPTLCFKFDFLSNFYFHRLIAACLGSKGWKILCDEEGKQGKCIYRNVCLFAYENQRVLIGVHNNIIQVQILFKEGDHNNLDFDITTYIRHHIEQNLQRLATTFTYSASYTVGYKCKTDSFGSVDTSFIEETDILGAEDMSCYLCPVQRSHQIPVTDIFKIWKNRLKVYGSKVLRKNFSQISSHVSALSKEEFQQLVKEVFQENEYKTDKKARLIFLSDVLISGNESCSKLVMSMKPYVGITVIRKMCDRCLSQEGHPKTKHKLDLSAFHENRNLLISELEPMELTDILLEEGAISEEEYKNIMLLDKRGEQATRLLTLLERKDESSLDSFIYALESLGFSVILRKIGTKTLKIVHNEQ